MTTRRPARPSDLRVETLTIPTAPVGDTNPLPPLFSGRDVHEVTDDGDADVEMRRGMRYGRVRSVLPYLTQDRYGRERTDTAHDVAVLENDVLRATFLLDAGGRLWSLVHKPTDRELLFRNPVFQPANLALRNAWFAGGVEWNIGTIGHSATTASPVYAVRVERPDGSPALRLYEYERLRGLVFSVDAWLHVDAPVLLVHVRVVNPTDEETPMYWWSNIAVPQAPDVRVLAPADSAWRCGDGDGLRRVPVPVLEGVDRTYPTRSSRAADDFLDVEERDRPWIAALDGAGRGLVQASTAALRGRKLFVWGTGRGGDHWQEWLCGEGSQYLEIQAGLARTQLEHVPMPARTTWDWVEAYGLLECDPTVVHGEDWGAARAHAGRRVDDLVPTERLEAALREATDWADTPPTAGLHAGSGWGALERIARSRAGDDSLDLPGTPFPDETLGLEQEPWLALVDGADRLTGDPACPPVSYQVGSRWLDRLARAHGWHAALQRGVARAAGGDDDRAEAEWTASLADEPTAWAHRNLGALARFRGDTDTALAHYRAAVVLTGPLLPLTLELVELLLEAGRPDEVLSVVESAPPDHRRSGRLRLAEARARLRMSDLGRVSTIVESGLVLPDIREGEASLTEFWDAYQDALRAEHERSDSAGRSWEPQPIPRDLDFDMRSP